MSIVKSGLKNDRYFYDDNDVTSPRDSPPLEAMRVNYMPSPTPPPSGQPHSADSTPEPEGEGCHKPPTRSKPRPNQGDAVLIAFMADGKHVDIARDAGEKPLASEIEEDEMPMMGGIEVVVSNVGEKGDTMAVVEEEEEERPVMQSTAISSDRLAAMQILAAEALRETARHSPEEAQKVDQPVSPKLKIEPPQTESEPMDGVKTTSASSTTKLHMDMPSSASHLSPDRRHETGTPSPVAAGELPPILHHSPQSGLTNGNGPSQITLPSISDQLGDINHLPEPPTGESAFSQSPPERPPQHRFPPVPSHGSPPNSPNDVFPRNQLPSPGRYYTAYANRRPSQSNGELSQYQSPNNHSGSNTETPASDQSGSTPGLSGMNRMSIEGITNPQVGAYQCNYQGCSALPFQTQVSIDITSDKFSV